MDIWRSSVSLNPTNLALSLNHEEWTYSSLDAAARVISHALLGIKANESKWVGLLAARSFISYAGVIGILGSSNAYVPLSPEFPPDRTAQMIARAGCRIVVVGAEALPTLKAIVEQCNFDVHWLLVDCDLPNWITEVPSQAFSRTSLRACESLSQPSVPVKSLQPAYLLFTSGSTGKPKGVAVSHANVVSYLAFVVPELQMTSADRCSQMFELTFDLSVHDMFVTWSSGACLCVPDRQSVRFPAHYMIQQRLSTWFSVPSMARIMESHRSLSDNNFPNLRLSLFCGEAFPTSLARRWKSTAANSRLLNLYGPTETTIAVTFFDLGNCDIDALPEVVPIGDPFPLHEISVIRPDMSRCEKEEVGELAIAGPQVSNGYWHDPEFSSLKFVQLFEDKKTWYRTGDLVSHTDQHGLLFKGRVDDQVQILGHRVELLEVDLALRSVLGTDSVVAVAFPPGAIAESIFAFAALDGDKELERELLKACRKKLPRYMVPQRVIFIDELPTNSNGKVDRSQLAKDLMDKRFD